MKRNKGDQPGNRNARKHGFYSKVLTRSEKLELQKAVSVEGLGDEIALLRLKIFQLLERDPDNLNLVLQASDILGRLVHINYLNPRHDNGLKLAIGNVWREIALPMGVKIDENFIGQL